MPGLGMPGLGMPAMSKKKSGKIDDPLLSGYGTFTTFMQCSILKRIIVLYAIACVNKCTEQEMTKNAPRYILNIFKKEFRIYSNFVLSMIEIILNRFNGKKYDDASKLPTNDPSDRPFILNSL